MRLRGNLEGAVGARGGLADAAVSDRFRGVRLGPIPESPVERVVGRLNLAPRPLLDTQIAYTLARVVMVGTKLGVFEALRDGPLAASTVAERCGLDPAGTEKLLFALAGAGYVEERDEGYALAPVARKWLLADSASSLADKMLLQFHEWEWLERAEEYVRTGEPLELHDAITDEQWPLYQRGMRAVAGAAAQEAARRLLVPRRARDMLDIGGSHGYFSVAVCRRHESLRAVVLDLPEAVEHAAPILAAEEMGDRVVHRAGDALTDDLGADAYDVVLIAQLVHHFSEEQNHALAGRVARALRPGGVYAILDSFRSPTARNAGQTGALLDFYFALTSQSGTWSPEEMAEWQRGAGLEPRRPIRFRTVPGLGIQAAMAPR
jgi:2-polyprenyl-3-methyl-5-hydroxy-6-metoxy-1,4-benzoquinol methylase